MNIIHQITNKCFKRDELNILTSPIHERFQSLWTGIPHQFWLIHCPNGKTWETKYAPLPKNHVLIPKNKPFPPEIDIDIVISQNKFDAYSYLAPIARKYNIPFISIEHTAPAPFWPKEQVEHMKTLKGDVNVFITDWSRERWGWKANECVTIYHGIDTDVFKPREVKKQDYILTVCNQFSKEVRHWACGFPVWQQVIKNDLKWRSVGDDPGFSEPAKSIDDLVNEYNMAGIFLNTSTVSPIPMSLMEAMSCGCACVSMATCDIPKFIQHGYNGLLGNNAEELRKNCIELLGNPELRYTLGQNARKTIVENFGLDKFVTQWNELFKKVVQ